MPRSGRKLFTDLAQRGVACTLDPNVRPAFVTDPATYRSRLEGMMKVASLVKLSDEDLGWLYPDADPETKAAELAAGSQAQLFVLTKGSQGASLITRSHRVEVEAAPVSALQDTVGAGDTFMAALIYQFLQSPDFGSEAAIRDVGRFAAKAAAINCERVGCNPPSLDEIGIWRASLHRFSRSGTVGTVRQNRSDPRRNDQPHFVRARGCRCWAGVKD